MSRSMVITLATCSTLNDGWAGDGDNNLAADVDPEERDRAFIFLDLLIERFVYVRTAVKRAVHTTHCI